MDRFYFVIQTKMEKEDYKKFLYLATFFRNKLTLPMILLLAFLGSAAIQLTEDAFSLVPFLVVTILMFVVAVAAVCFQVERKNQQRVTTDKTGAFGSISTLRFGEEVIEMENEAMHSSGELRYDQIYQLLETHDYFIFYLTANQASLVRKKDVTEVAAFRTFLQEKFAGKYKKMGKV